MIAEEPTAREYPGMSQELTKYDEQMVRKYIEKITVFDNCFEVEFKAGLKIEIEKWILWKGSSGREISCSEFFIVKARLYKKIENINLEVYNVYLEDITDEDIRPG